MDYPTKHYTCNLCGRRYTDEDGGCDCLTDKFLCPGCGAIQNADALTFPKIRRAADGRRIGRIVCAACARCAACEAATGTVFDEHGAWLCVQCAGLDETKGPTEAP